VALLARSEREIDALAAEIGPAALALRCDVADWASVQQAVATVVQRFGRLDVLVTKRNELEEAQLSGLVKTYESMKPEDAARIFNRLERGILVDVASRMKPAKIGAVLAAMEAARAQDLTVLLARRLKVTLNSPAAPAVPAVAAPASPGAEAPQAPNG
jgi:flagellar motility protein MotE (MotC chaperone)